jgi:hypothetical protein
MFWKGNPVSFFRNVSKIRDVTWQIILSFLALNMQENISVCLEGSSESRGTMGQGNPTNCGIYGNQHDILHYPSALSIQNSYFFHNGGVAQAWRYLASRLIISYL